MFCAGSKERAGFGQKLCMLRMLGMLGAIGVFNEPLGLISFVFLADPH